MKSYVPTCGKLGTLEDLIDAWHKKEVGDTGLVLGDLESSEKRKNIDIDNDAWQRYGRGNFKGKKLIYHFVRSQSENKGYYQAKSELPALRR